MAPAGGETASPSGPAASGGDTVMLGAASSAATASAKLAGEVSMLASSIAAMSVAPGDLSSPARSKEAKGADDSVAVPETPLPCVASSPAAAASLPSPHTPVAAPVASRLGDDHGAFVLCRPDADAEDFECRAKLTLPAANGHPLLELAGKLRADFAQTLQLLFTPDGAALPRGTGPARVGASYHLPERKLLYALALPLYHIDSWAYEGSGSFALTLRTDRPGVQPPPGGMLPAEVAARLSGLPAEAPAFPQTFGGAPVVRLSVDCRSNTKNKSPGEEGGAAPWSSASRLEAALAAALVPNAFHAAYRMVQRISSGAEGEVWRAERRNNSGAGCEAVAVKIPLNTMHSLAHEAAMLRGAVSGSPYLVSCLDFLSLQEGSTTREYLVLEWMHGGSLVHYIMKREAAGKPLSEDEARACVARLLRGLRDMHAAKVPHRDIKADNLLLAAADDVRSVKLADLGHAKEAATPSLRTFTISGRGTLLYNAPERVDADGDGYTAAADVWSLGVTLYALLMGCFPFGGIKQHVAEQETARAILHDSWRPRPGSASAARLGACSAACSDLLDAMLQKDPAQRITVAAALAHPWLASEPEDY